MHQQHNTFTFLVRGILPRAPCLGGGEPLRVAKPALPRPRTPNPFRARLLFSIKVNLNMNLGLIQPEGLIILLCVEKGVGIISQIQA